MLKLSYTSKMPCASFALPAGEKCPTGSKLINMKGSVCASCYARKGFGQFPGPAAVRQENWRITVEALKSKPARKKWIADLSALIIADGGDYFRWHDAGDLLSPAHLNMIFDVCEATKHVTHWLPTREYSFVKTVLSSRDKPSNLTIRLSAHQVGKTLKHTLPTSSVMAGVGHKCHATYDKKLSGGKCLACRACWLEAVRNIDYNKH